MKAARNEAAKSGWTSGARFDGRALSFPDAAAVYANTFADGRYLQRIEKEPSGDLQIATVRDDIAWGPFVADTRIIRCGSVRIFGHGANQ